MAARKILVFGDRPRSALFKKLNEIYTFAFVSTTAMDREKALWAIQEKSKQGPWSAILFAVEFRNIGCIDRELLHPLSSLGLVVKTGAGYDTADIQWMTEAGIVYANCPLSVRRPTAEFAVYLILAALKNSVQMDRAARKEEWKRLVPADDIEGRKLGIVGLGGIGAQVARRMLGFGVKIAYYQRTRLPEKEERALDAAFYPTLESLLTHSDIVSLHCPLTARTRHLLNARTLALLPRGSIVVNTARGAVIDEEALVDALKSGHVERAGLDVFEQEPHVHPYLRDSDQVIMAPHRAANTHSTAANLMDEALENVHQFLETGQPNTPVNKPNR